MFIEKLIYNISELRDYCICKKISFIKAYSFGSIMSISRTLRLLSQKISIKEGP